MQQNNENLFNQIQPIEPPNGLFEKIINRIQKEQVKIFRRKAAIFSFLIICSLIAFIPTLKILQTDFNQSGFLQFFALAFSDFGSIMIYWQTFLMTLLESLPIISIIVFLGIIFIFLVSLKFLVHNLKFLFSQEQIIYH